MTRVIKSDLLYSVLGGFLLGCAALFFSLSDELQLSMIESLSSLASFGGNGLV